MHEQRMRETLLRTLTTCSMDARTANARNTPTHTHYMYLCKLQIFRPNPRAICPLRGGVAAALVSFQEGRPSGAPLGSPVMSVDTAKVKVAKNLAPRRLTLPPIWEPRSPRDENTRGSVPAPRREAMKVLDLLGEQLEATSRSTSRSAWQLCRLEVWRKFASGTPPRVSTQEQESSSMAPPGMGLWAFQQHERSESPKRHSGTTQIVIHGH